MPLQCYESERDRYDRSTVFAGTLMVDMNENVGCPESLGDGWLKLATTTRSSPSVHLPFAVSHSFDSSLVPSLTPIITFDLGLA